MLKKICVVICIVLAAIEALAADGIIVRGRVCESFMGTDIVGARLRLLTAADSTEVLTMEARYHIRNGNQEWYTSEFRLEVPATKEPVKYVLEISAPEYATQYFDIDPSSLGKSVYTKDLKTIYLERELARRLGEVTVTATKVKFYNRGDTLVYDADAFNLAEGSMLDALISQLPGVELRDNGEILVDGRKVESLLLNGRDFMGDNRRLMLDNLAAYTVKNIELYDKAGRMSELAGTDMGDTQYVMDVKLRKEFMLGLTLNAEAGYGTSDRYLGRLFAMAFTKHNRYTAFFNANNLNNSEKPGEYSQWNPDKMPTGRRRTISGGFDYSLRPEGSRWEFDGSADASREAANDGTDRLRENFLEGGNTFDYGFSRSRTRTMQVGTRHKINYKGGAYSLTLQPKFSYRRYDNEGENVEATFSRAFNDVSSAFIRDIYQGNTEGALRSLINRNISLDKTKGHSLNAGSSLWQGIKVHPSGNMITIDAGGEYTNRHDDRFSRFDINYGSDPVAAQHADRYYRGHPSHSSKTNAGLGYAHVFGRGVSLRVNYAFRHDYMRTTSSLFRLEQLASSEPAGFGRLPSAQQYEPTLDPSNSYLSRNIDDTHSLKLTLYLSKGPWWVQWNLPVSLLHQRLDYRRGTIDTTLTRNSVKVDVTNAFVQWEQGNHTVFWNTELHSSAPDLIHMVDMRDDLDPLNVTLGNSGLRNALDYRTHLTYQYMDEVHRSAYGATIEYGTVADALARGYTYDSSTGVRTLRTYNVNGNWNYGLSFSNRHALPNRWMIANRVAGAHYTSVDLVGYNSPVLSRSKVYRWNISETFNVTKDFGENSIRLLFQGDLNRFDGNRPDFTAQNAWTLQTQLWANFKLPANFSLSTDFSVYNRRGYADNVLNTDNFVWNARLTYSALKGALLVMLDGYDLLHNLSNVSYTINAQSRTESYRTVLPSYVMLHVQWRLTHNPAKKKR